MKLSLKELRRQTLHFVYGPFLIGLHFFFAQLDWQGWVHVVFLSLIMTALALSYWIKKHQDHTLLGRFMMLFERFHHFQSFPGKGPIFFTLGAYLSFLLFKTEVAYASIMILSVGDAVSPLVGSFYGKIKTPLNPEKYVEGNIVACLLAIPFAFVFFPHLIAVVLASLAAMMVEMPNLKIKNWSVDDNLTIPLVAGVVLSFFV